MKKLWPPFIKKKCVWPMRGLFSHLRAKTWENGLYIHWRDPGGWEVLFVKSPIYSPSLPLILVREKKMSVIAFRIALTLDIKMVWFGCQVAVCVKKWHTNAFVRCSRFQKVNFDCLLHKLLICSPTTKKHLKCLSWTMSFIIFSGIQIYFSLYLALSHKSWC